jgi:23S rRNA (uracil1939-C5)-methyltransferase
VVFLPLAAPGDRLRARVRRRARGYLRAEIVDLLSPGPDRIAPPCDVFGRCGGCQWQHVALAAQRRAKQEIVVEQLARLGGLRDVPVRPTLAPPDGLGYRARVTLRAEGRRLGYQRARSHVLEEVAACPIATAAVGDHLATARDWAARLRTAPERITIAEAPGGVVLVGTLGGPPAPPDVAATESLLAAQATVRGAVLLHAAARVVVGDPTVRLELEPGLALEAPADAFAQVNPAANRLLVATVLALADFRAGTTVLDLYCGAGNFALPLARRGLRVVGIERDAHAVLAARANAARLGLDARFVAGDVVTELARSRDPVDGVVLDPPRAGAAEALPALVARRPDRIVYVSCDPATLARDLRWLAGHGYAVRVVQPIDVFPQTFHVETVTLLGLT